MLEEARQAVDNETLELIEENLDFFIPDCEEFLNPKRLQPLAQIDEKTDIGKAYQSYQSARTHVMEMDSARKELTREIAASVGAGDKSDEVGPVSERMRATPAAWKTRPT